MINVKDLIPTETANVYRYEELDSSGVPTGNYKYFKYAPGNLASEPTPLDRDLFMKLQGFIASNTVFNADGSITESNAEGVAVTTFLDSGNIEQIFTSTEGHSIGLRTIFNADGSISTEVF